MSRPRLRMLLAILIVVAVVWVGRRTPQSVPVMALVALIAWFGSVGLGRDFFRGRAAMAARNYTQAIDHFQQFVRRASSKRVRALKFLWLGLYTSDPVALAFNNIGACYLNMRNLEKAIVPLEEALRRDVRYAVPHVNLAIVRRLQGNVENSEHHARCAVRLGYSESALDAMIRGAIALHNEAVGRRV